MTPIVKPTAPAPKPKRMTMANVTRGRIVVPLFVLLYGEPKVGKTTFVAGAPGVVWIDLDGGSAGLNVMRFPQVQTFADVLEALDEVATTGEREKALPIDQKTIQTVVVDPLSHLEPLIHHELTGGKTVNTNAWGGGFKAFDNAVRDRVRVFFAAVQRCWRAGIHTWLLAHSTEKNYNNPEGQSFPVFALDLSKEMAGFAMKTVEAILFVKREVFAKVDATKRAKASGSGLHMLYTEGTPAFKAGNRLSLPPVLPLSWPAFADALANSHRQLDAMLAEIEAGLVTIGDEAVTTLVRGWLKDRTPAEVLNAVRGKLSAIAEDAAAQGATTDENEEETTTNDEEAAA